MEREDMINKLMELAYDYDEYFFKQWLGNNVIVENYEDDGGNISYDFEVI